jgi:hypothetical protein
LGQLRWRLGLIARQSPSPVHQGPRPIRLNSLVQFGANTHSYKIPNYLSIPEFW